MTIMREWRAEVRRALKDIDADRTEIVTLSWWKDEASIKAFAGADSSRSRYYPQDDRFLLTRPETVQHYESTAPSSH
jgi:hypothetical protein